MVEKQGVECLLLESLVSTTSLESLAKGYILSGDVFSLQYVLGHSTLQMTQRYLQSLNANDAARAHQKFSPLDNLGKF
jgi:integrase